MRFFLVEFRWGPHLAPKSEVVQADDPDEAALQIKKMYGQKTQIINVKEVELTLPAKRSKK